MDITLKEYSDFQHFLRRSCGIEIGENKQYLVKNRLASVLREFNLTSFSELLSHLDVNSVFSNRLKSKVIDAMTTNETFWFRDDSQFLALKNEVLPEFFLKSRGTVKIWSAACSSGQEPYTMSMCVEEMARSQSSPLNVQIVGTDISEAILNEARTAIYSDMAISRGLDSKVSAQYFQKMEAGHQLKSEISRRVRFQHLNLLQSFSSIGRFDVIFCRNVLIYFSDEVKRDILRRLVDALEPGGYLFLSSTESVPMDMLALSPVRGRQARYFKKVG
ncbi:MAG: protein-glutamate O-methyltransferase CheR [Methyloprofundus sp.]|nr:protein-glutamate O-methyltransferase CheR [Methyloprofundus sp.]MDT8425564.1 protein-glutamate O-methyltransferase CheR [Methyloprofundus sp.]